MSSANHSALRAWLPASFPGRCTTLPPYSEVHAEQVGGNGALKGTNQNPWSELRVQTVPAQTVGSASKEARDVLGSSRARARSGYQDLSTRGLSFRSQELQIDEAVGNGPAGKEAYRVRRNVAKSRLQGSQEGAEPQVQTGGRRRPLKKEQMQDRAWGTGSSEQSFGAVDQNAWASSNDLQGREQALPIGSAPGGANGTQTGSKEWKGRGEAFGNETFRSRDRLEAASRERARQRSVGEWSSSREAAAQGREDVKDLLPRVQGPGFKRGLRSRASEGSTGWQNIEPASNVASVGQRLREGLSNTGEAGTEVWEQRRDGGNSKMQERQGHGGSGSSRGEADRLPRQSEGRSRTQRSSTSGPSRERRQDSGRRDQRSNGGWRPTPRAPVNSRVSSTRALAAVRMMRVEQGGAFVDVLAGEGDSAWEDEMLYVERTLGFRTAPLDARDFRQVTDLVGGSVRWKRYLDFLVASFFQGEQRSLERMEPLLAQILRLGLYEMLMLEKPPYAVINEMVELAKAALRPGAGNMVNAILHRVLRSQEQDSLPLPKVEGDDRARARALATIYSHPVWLVRRWVKRFGEEEAAGLLQWNNERPTYSLRANSLQGVTRDALSDQLRDLKVDHELSPHLGDFVRLSSGMQEVLHAGLLKDGTCTVQDESAGLVVSLLDPQPGESVVDCCAAPGGKTLFAAARMGGTGQLLAVDVNEGRVRMVGEAAQRQGVAHMVQTKAADIRDLAKGGTVSADRVLLDAPCSGLGVLCKRADLRWRRTPEAVEELTVLQDELLDAAASMVRPGGLLVYSTCSIEPQENGDRVTAFLARNPEFAVESASGYVPEVMLTSEGFFASLPHRDHIDGAFGARLRRTGGNATGLADDTPFSSPYDV